MLKHALAAAFLLVSAAALAQAAPPLVNPVTLSVGASVHLTPIDQNSVPVPIVQCTLLNLPPATATFVKDATGVILTGVAPASNGGVRWQCGDGVNPAVLSPGFFVTVVPAPYSVTAVGDTMP